MSTGYQGSDQMKQNWLLLRKSLESFEKFEEQNGYQDNWYIYL